MKNIAFFLSAQNIDKKYSEPALELIKLCIEQNYAFVYGGSEHGLMKTAAAFARSLNGKIIAVSSEEFRHILSPEADGSYIEKDILERKRRFLAISDAIIALPGGSGTLDEITDIIALKKMKTRKKPIVLFNIEGFWDGLIEQCNRMYKDGFLPIKPDQLFLASDSPKEIIKYLRER